MRLLFLILFIVCFTCSGFAANGFRYFEPEPHWGLRDCSIAWGDYDNDGYPDLAVAGYSNAHYYFSVYKNNGDGTINPNEILPDSPLGFSRASLAWGDYDRDGYFDLAVTGYGYEGGWIYPGRIYNNQGTGAFNPAQIELGSGFDYPAIKWFDYNKDNYPDLLVAGAENGGTRRLYVYKNNKNSTFTPFEVKAGWGVVNGAVTTGDFNKDGFDDIAVTGLDGGGTGRFHVYINSNGQGFHYKAIKPEPNWGLQDGGICTADYNNDGYLDLAVTGYFTGALPIARSFFRIYFNTCTDSTNLFSSDELEPDERSDFGVRYSSIASIDYNKDGNMDLVLAGYNDNNSINQTFFRIYKNNGDGTFDPDEIEPQPGWGVEYCSISVADYDKDGDQDIAIAGNVNHVTATNCFRIYENLYQAPVIKAGKNEVKILPNYISQEESEIRVFVTEVDDPEEDYQVLLTTISGGKIRDLGKIKFTELQAGYSLKLLNENDKSISTGLYLVVVKGSNNTMTKKLYIRR